MLLSMTGFAEEKISLPAIGTLYIELKSINQKNLELQLRLPEEFSFLEELIREEIQGRIKRGRLLFTIKTGTDFSGDLYINEGLIKKYIQKIKELKRKFKLEGELRLETLINLPEVLILKKEKTILEKNLTPIFKKTLERVIEKLIQSRKKEGRFLEKHILDCIKNIKKKLNLIKSRFKKVVSKKIKTLATEEERLSFLKAVDINEELRRLDFHIKNFCFQVEKESSSGKELDFIAQEMLREANTISTKSFDAKIIWWLIKIRTDIEQIRQQLQNVE
ncbi:MAG: YicC family protein [Candidatus Omnitrophica bacterium]|nr:YicC family protein [Candidatus Omnitrophota bacterium]